MNNTDSFLICPNCVVPIVNQDQEFYCEKCEIKFPAEEGIGILIPNPQKHLKFIEEQMESEKKDWYTADQEKSYFKGPYRFHLEKRKNYVKNLLDNFPKLKRKGLKLLDLGCGDGVNLKWLSSYSSNIYGADYNLLRLKRARKLLENIHPNTKLFLVDIYKIPFAENSFDIIFFNHVIEHLKDDFLAMKKIYHITKKGGSVILGTPNEGALFWRFAYKIEPKVKNTTDHVNFYTSKSISELAKKVGFKIRHVEYMGWGIPIWRIDPLFRKHMIFENLFEFIGKRIFKKQATSLYLILEK